MGLCQSAKVDNYQIPNIFEVDISKIERHTYSGQYKYCRLDHVYDGDTADIYFYEGDKIIRHPFRFYGYDSAEIKPLKSIANREEVKLQSLDDKQFLTSLVQNQKLVVQFMENEKFGRMMGIIWKVSHSNIPEELLFEHPELTDTNNICNIMINTGHGKPYYGGKKG